MTFGYQVNRLLTDCPDIFMVRVLAQKKKVALTFDDGPDKTYTEQVLDILQENKVRATFYYVGDRILKYPHVVKRTVAEGHEIGNHSWSHPNLRYLNGESFKEEILKNRRVS